jgi:PDZ domain
MTTIDRGPLSALFLLVLTGLLVIGLPARGAEPGDLEKGYLRAAIQGHLENVYILRMFHGFMAFPRTFVLSPTGIGSVRVMVDLHTDSSIKSGGSVISGLRVEYYEPQGEAHTPKVVITDSTTYMMLTGSATVLAKDLVDTYTVLTGPPDIFSRNRAPGASTAAGADAPQSGEPAATANAGGDPSTCDGVVKTARIFVATSSPPLMIRIFPGTDADAFREVGFARGDVIVAVNGRPVVPTDDVTTLLRGAAAGKPLAFSLERGAGRTQLTVTADSATRALVSCAK